MLPTVCLLAVLLVGALVAHRLNEEFFVSIRDAEVMVVRGFVPRALLEAFSDIARDVRIERATLRAVRGSRGTRLFVRGVDDRVAQCFRNVFGSI
jgi:hypothetical protein